LSLLPVTAILYKYSARSFPRGGYLTKICVMKIFVISLGCPKNLTDTEEMMGLLVGKGHELSPSLEGADAVLLNTCAFIKPAVEESETEIRRLISLKKKKVIGKIAVAGCLVQREKERLLSKFPQIDALTGVASIDKVADMLEGGGVSIRPLSRRLYSAPLRVGATMPHSVYLKIADGCDNKCTFCTIPSLRGPYRSKPLEAVLAEAASLVKAGAKEISLVAQDTTSYGKDIYGRPVLDRLLVRLCKIRGLRWIRIMYAYPELVDEKLVRLIAREEKICKYLDMPLQHYSSAVLRRMGRGLREEDIDSRLAMIRRLCPGLAVRTNFIVGFPGETAADFEKLLSFVRRARLSSAGVFEYSPEAGTPAALLDGRVPSRTAARRAAALVEAQSLSVDEDNTALLGYTMPVLMDSPVRGRMQSDAPDIDGSVEVSSRKSLKPGDIVRVKITAAQGYQRKGRAL